MTKTALVKIIFFFAVINFKNIICITFKNTQEYTHRNSQKQLKKSPIFKKNMTKTRYKTDDFISFGAVIDF